MKTTDKPLNSRLQSMITAPLCQVIINGDLTHISPYHEAKSPITAKLSRLFVFFSGLQINGDNLTNAFLLHGNTK